MGASTGIGKALAINYASDNTILGLAARRIESVSYTHLTLPTMAIV